MKYCKGKSELQSSVGAFNPECNAKTSKNALRLALNLHVLWHRLDNALNQLTGSTPNVVLESTMNMTLTLHDTLLAFSGVAEAVSNLIWNFYYSSFSIHFVLTQNTDSSIVNICKRSAFP